MDTDTILRHEIANIIHPLLLTAKVIEEMIEQDRKEEALKVIRTYLKPTLERAAIVLRTASDRAVIGIA